MTTILGTERTDSCRGCIGGRDKNGPGNGKPFQRSQRIIKLRSKRFVMQCRVCGTRNVRKLRRLTDPPKRKGK